jgi:hypothetical protein
MKILRYAAAIIITIVLLIIARNLSPGKSTVFNGRLRELTAEHATVPKIIDGKLTRVAIKIDNPGRKTISVKLRWKSAAGNLDNEDQYNMMPMLFDDSAKNYTAQLPLFSKGEKIFYFIEILGETGEQLIRLPQAKDAPVKVKYEGVVPLYILVPHVLLMFVAIYFATLAVIDAFGIITGNGRLAFMAKNYLWATLAVFFGGYPFGWGMNYFAFGMIWEGIPFGWDFTDNKTQIILLYLIFLCLSSLGALSKGKWKDNYSERTLGWMGIVGYLLVLAIYIIPHSIQFSLPATALFAYGLTSIIVGLYVYGLTRKQKWNETKLRN